MDALYLCDSQEPGFTPVVENEGWTVGVVNYMDRLNPNGLIKRERHLLTDELFILVEGEACMHLGEEMVPHPLEKGKAFLMKKGIWHAISMSPDAKVYVVENSGTGPCNTEYFFFNK